MKYTKIKLLHSLLKKKRINCKMVPIYDGFGILIKSFDNVPLGVVLQNKYSKGSHHNEVEFLPADKVPSMVKFTFM